MRRAAVLLFAGLGLAGQARGTPAAQPAVAPPSDAEFVRMVREFAEPGGAFHSDNFTSNEPGYPEMALELSQRRPGGAYLGVGPEQNFSLIVASRPEIAFIVDIRRQAVIQHLWFKAMLELSDDRAEFLARVFARPRPDVRSDASIEDIWAAWPRDAPAEEARLQASRAAVVAALEARGIVLRDEDTAMLDYVATSFATLGPAINYAGFRDRLTTGGVDFRLLSLARDPTGRPRSFLASEENFQHLRRLQTENRIVPIEGDFAGPRTLRSIGEYLRGRGLVVRTFYVSNVEQYLFGGSSAPDVDVNGGWRAFYDNLAALPADGDSILLRAPTRLRQVAACPLRAFVAAARAGRIASYRDARTCDVSPTAARPATGRWPGSRPD